MAGGPERERRPSLRNVPERRAPSAAFAFRARRSRFGAPLPTSFFERPTERVARDLLGAVLSCCANGTVSSGRIVEVEAYLGPGDPACHAAAGITKRNRHLHGPPGTAYVYRIYGMHWCVNAVTREVGHGSAVLIRALDVVDGIEIARERRKGVVRDRDLANGPGKLCQALGITGMHDGLRLDRGSLQLRQGAPVSDDDVVVSPRIGISKAIDWPLRYFVRGSANVSRPPQRLEEWPLATAPKALRPSS